jgi:hypothetical protein
VFLLKNRSENGSLNYWSRDFVVPEKLRYPDDLDDTFCALSALKLYDEKIVDGELLAKVASTLISTETREGGPYRTWLVDSSKADKNWLDIDLAVNSNIAYFLNLNEIRLETIEKFVNKAILKNSVVSPYYPSTIHVLFFISRFYNGRLKDKLAELVLGAFRQEKLNPYELCLIAQSLLNLGLSNTEIFEKVKSLSKKEILQPFPYSIDPSIDGKKYYAGCAELTAALYLNTINRLTSNLKAELSPAEHKPENNIITKITELYSLDISQFAPDFKLISKDTLSKILKHPLGKEILLIAHYSYCLLSKSGQKKVGNSNIISLGLANLYGWIAYTIYDDFTDKEGDPIKLPFANFCLRRMTAIYEELSSDGFYEKIISVQDQTSLHEINNFRFNPKQPLFNLKLPKISKNFLYKKSIGHMVGPLLVFKLAGYNENSNEFKSLEKLFQDYLAARQLADDMHDWEDDLRRGQLNYVSVDILKNYYGDEYNIESLNEFYWENLIRDHINFGYKLLIITKNSKLITADSAFANIVDNLLNIYKKTETERENAKQFLNNLS